MQKTDVNERHPDWKVLISGLRGTGYKHGAPKANNLRDADLCGGRAMTLHMGSLSPLAPNSLPPAIHWHKTLTFAVSPSGSYVASDNKPDHRQPSNTSRPRSIALWSRTHKLLSLLLSGRNFVASPPRHTAAEGPIRWESHLSGSSHFALRGLPTNYLIKIMKT